MIIRRIYDPNLISPNKNSLRDIISIFFILYSLYSQVINKQIIK